MAFLIALLLFVGAGGCFFMGRKKHHIHQLMVNTETSSVEALTQGPCEVQGQIDSIGSPFISPWTQQRCVYYDFQVEERRSRRRGNTTSTYWADYITDLQAQPFTVSDQSGSVEINPGDVDFRVRTDARERSGFGDDASSELQALLRDRYGASTQGWVFNKTLRYSENVLAVGDTVYVFGEVRRQGDKLFIGSGLMPLIVAEDGEHFIEEEYSKSATYYLVGAIVLIIIGLGLVVLGFVD
jgi:hypothetical protein